MGRNKSWTKDEENYLVDNWGTYSLTNISNKLNRSENAILNKVFRLKLGSFLENGDYITVRQLFMALGHNEFDTYKIKSWIENRKLPIKQKLINEKRVKVITLNDFWKWAEKNKSFLDFSKFTRYTLGKEPDWVEEKRRNDILHNSKYKKTPWTVKEDEYLKFLLRQFKYSYKDISEKTQRTIGAISRRMVDLDLKERPIKAYNHNKWESKEIQTVENMIVQGFSYELISEEVGRSTKAIAGKIYRMYGTQELDLVRIRIKEVI